MNFNVENNKALSLVLIQLMKGVLYAREHPRQWQQLLDLQVQVCDYVRVLGLSLSLHEDEGFAWLETIQYDDPDDALPKLVIKRQLSYPVSLLLALLRKKLVEHDSQSSEDRLIMTRDDIVDMLRTFLPDSTNEARVVDQIDSYINKVIELGFARRLKADKHRIEIRRIIQAFVDAQWLAEFDQRLQQYLQFTQAESP